MMDDELLFKIIEYLNPCSEERAINEAIEAIKSEFPESFKTIDPSDLEERIKKAAESVGFTAVTVEDVTQVSRLGSKTFKISCKEGNKATKIFVSIFRE